MAESKKEYQVDYRLTLDQDNYEPGEKIALTEKQAKPLLETVPPVISVPGKKTEDKKGDQE